MNCFFTKKIIHIIFFSCIPFQIRAMKQYDRQETTRLNYLLEKLSNSTIELDQLKKSGSGFNCLKQLIIHGADPNTVSYQGFTAIDPAVQFNNPEFVRFLLAHGFEPNLRNKKGDTPLILSADSPEIMQILLDHGAIVNSVNKNNESALWWASRNNKAESVRLLLAKKADPDFQDQLHGYTALMWAASNDRKDIADMLLKANAQVDLKSKYGADAFMISTKKYGVSPVAKLFLKK